MTPQTPPADRPRLSAPAITADCPSGSWWCGVRSESVNVLTRPDRPRVHEQYINRTTAHAGQPRQVNHDDPRNQNHIDPRNMCASRHCPCARPRRDGRDGRPRCLMHSGPRAPRRLQWCVRQPLRPQNLRCLLFRKYHAVPGERCVARSRGKALFHDPQGGFPPLPRLKVVRNSLREVDHDAEHGPINRRTDRYRGHCQSLGGDRPIVEPATSQSCLDERSESGWEAPHILCRNQHRQQRSRTHQEEKRLPIHHNSVDVPIAERRIGAGRDDLRCRQQRVQLSCRPKYDHVPV